MKKVMVFGVFDGVHAGHRSLFRQALKEGDHLIVVVTPDRVVDLLKHRLPERNLSVRIAELHKEKLPHRIATGDAELGAWGVLFEHEPEVIALGYDQEGLHKSLMEHMHRFHWKPRVTIMKPFKPETHHSSLLKKKNGA